MNVGFGNLERREQVRFNLTLQKSQAAKFREQLSEFPAYINDAAGMLSEDDQLRITYDLFVGYFDNVARCLGALKTILGDPGVIVKAELTELTKGECLIAAVLDRLREVQQSIRQRGSNES